MSQPALIKTDNSISFRFNEQLKSSFLPAVTIIVLLAIWQLTVTVAQVPAYILPPPSAIANRFIVDLFSGEIIPHLTTTFIEVVFGLVIAAFLGIGLGTMIGIFSVVEKCLYPVVMITQTVPKIAIAPLLIIWFGYGISSKIATAALISFFPILVNVITGIKTVDMGRISLMHMLCANPWQIYLKVRLPNMLSYLFAGLEVAVVLSLIGAIVGEFVGASEGLGSLIIQRQSQVDVTGVFSVLVYLSATGLFLTTIVKYARKRIIFWNN